MNRPTLCVIHEGVGTESAIARVALDNVQCALRAGWNITVIAKTLDPSVRGDVEWLPLYVPPRGFLLKWLTARHFIRAAMGRRVFDAVHTHQPQAAAFSDLFTCHYLTRAVRDRHALPPWLPIRSGLARLQQLGALPAEDACFRRWNPATRILFCSAMLRDEFLLRYPRPPRHEVMENACAAPRPATESQRLAARERLAGSGWSGPVIGYLGGVDPRKGYRQLLQAMQSEPGVRLLLGGPGTGALDPAALPPQCKPLGWISDFATFFAACDALVVPSLFDPCPLAALDAIAHGVPVIATHGVGNLPTLLRYKAGVEWVTGLPLGRIARIIASRRPDFQAAALRLAADLSKEHQAKRLLEIYETIRCEKHASHARR